MQIYVHSEQDARVSLREHFPHRMVEFVFWASVLSHAYTFGLFPACMSFLSRFSRARHRSFAVPVDLPRVAIIFAAHNEEAVIAARLDNLVRLDYPTDKLQVLIGSDASTDATDRIVADYAAQYGFIQLVRFDQRTGKAPILNHLVERSNAEIIVLTDADVLFAPDILRHLVAPFGDPGIGLVSARMLRTSEHATGFHSIETGFYSNENRLKYAEAVLCGMIMGADGACYALRRSLYTPFPNDRRISDDLLQTLQVAAQGYTTWYALDAVCTTGIPDEPGKEFRRKARVACSNHSTLRLLPSVFLRPWTCGGWLFYSHKLLRWYGGFLLVLAALSGWLLAGTHWIYQALAITLSVVLLLPLVPENTIPPPLRYLRHFALMNYAQAAGFFCWLRGKNPPYWQPPQRGATVPTPRTAAAE